MTFCLWVFSDGDEAQSVGGEAPGGETENAAETWCRCWKGKDENNENTVRLYI